MTKPLTPHRFAGRTAGLYLVLMAAANLVWEVAQFPLYQIWLDGSLFEQAYAIVHCTIGDVMIAASSLALAYGLVGRGVWPDRRYAATTIAATMTGVAYTIFSEWLNISVRGSWAYRDIMPLVPPFGTGLTPLLQWLILPPVMFAIAQKKGRSSERPRGE